MKSLNTVSIESEAGFRVLFECATIGIIVIDEDGIIVLSNPCAEKLFEYSPAELLGKPIEVLIPVDLRHRHADHRQHYFSKPKARPMGLGIELYAQRKAGDVFPVEISLGHYELNGNKLAVAFITDITDQVKARKIVANREAWFRNMADNSPVMIWVSGTDKLCTYFNNTWLQFTGSSLEEELGSGWIHGVHPDDVEKCLDIYATAFDSRKAFSMEYRLKRHDGQYRWILDTGKATYSEDIFTGYIGSCSDIHDQKMMTEELETLVLKRTNELSDALEREMEMNELKSRFVSMASHEFRTPLSVVLSSTSLIEQYNSPIEDDRVKKHVTRIKSSILNLTNILNDFLSLDKLEQGKVDIETEEFDLHNLIHEVIEDAGLLRKKGQEITLNYLGDNHVVLDEKKLRYVLINLISNSIKYSPEDSEIFIGTNREGDQLVIKIQDHGIGIPADEQKHLFDKFFRARNSASAQGTGLGLTIVKRYVELLRGDVGFVSEEGKGTSFTIKIPVI